MRKHNRKFATRFGRTDGDRSNFPQSAAHSLVHNKQFQFHANALLKGLIRGVQA